MRDGRRELRASKTGTYSLTWKDQDGLMCSAEGRGVDVSKSGIGIESLREFRPGATVHVETQDSTVKGDCVVRHCTRRGIKFHIGLEFSDEMKTRTRAPEAAKTEREADYYDVLQISPKAEQETIHRVFRIMAARFHPDNPETGDLEEFLRLKRAYSALSDPDRRAEYDALRQSRETGTMPIFEMKDFVTGVEAESNRRLGVLSLLYNQRRADPDHPSVSLLNLEQRMGFPREYLSFTMWYLRAKDYIQVADNSDYALSAAGADYVEKHAAKSEIVCRLLKTGGTRMPPMTKVTNVRQDQASPSRKRFLLGSSRPDPAAN